MEVANDRDGIYIFEGVDSKRLAAKEKSIRFLDYLRRKTDRTAGESIELTYPPDLSLTFSRSEKESDAILEYLGEQRLVKAKGVGPLSRLVTLTIEGADDNSDFSVMETGVAQSKLRRIDVEITGPRHDSGLFGVVFPGIQTQLNRKVALKIIQPHAKPGAIEHALGLAKINHPNVVTVFDVGTTVDPQTNETAECVVMEWIEGRKLHDVWQDISSTLVQDYCRQLIDGVHAMHEAGVCHYDLHAGNVMVGDNRLKIIDVHYADSARFSNVSTAPRELLIKEDWSAVARIVRSLIWNAGACDVDSSWLLTICKAASATEIESSLKQIFGDGGNDGLGATTDLEFAIEGRLLELSHKAQKVIRELPYCWEYLLYSQILQDNLLECEELKKDWDLGISLGYQVHVDPDELMSWILSHQKELTEKVNAVNALFRGDILEDAFGAPGEPGNPKGIAYLADRLGGIYRESIEWSIRCRSVCTDELFDRLLHIVSRLVENIVKEIEDFSGKMADDLEALIQNPPEEDEHRTLEATLVLTVPDELHDLQVQELDRIARRFGAG